MSPQPLELFYSYSHKDEELRDQLEEHLAMLKREGVITNWHDRRISGGKEWEGQIDEHLNSAHIILLLTSSAFLASDYCYDVEVKRAMERHQEKQARVIPVVLRACDWQSAPFGKLQALPKDGKPVKQWADQDVAFLDIANGIRLAANEIVAQDTYGRKDREPDDITPNPYLFIPDLRVRFVRRKDNSDNDIVELLQEELSPRPRLVALWGAGGVGKTAIAAEAARGLEEAFTRRVAWVSADGLDNFNLPMLLDEIATQLGHPEVRKLAADLKKEQVRDLLRTSPTLIVLDNFETIEASERVRCVEWLSKPAPCSALITTRDAIEGVRNIPIEVMRHDEANALLDQLINQAHDVRAFSELDRDRLIGTAEANPLVLQWIVGQIDLAQDPDEVLDDLRHGEGTAAERVFNRSYELKQLNNGGRAVLLALSLFAPSATRKAVAEISGLGKDTDRRKFRDAVRSLSALWLIHTAEDTTRLAVAGLTRELTRAKLDSDPRGKTFRPRFVSRFVRFADSHALSTREDYDSLEREKDNLQTAADIAFSQGNWKSVIRLSFILAAPSRGVLHIRGYWYEAIKISTLGLEAAISTESEDQIANESIGLAGLYYQRGDLQEAKGLYKKSFEIAKKLSNARGIGLSLWGLALIAADQGELEEASKNNQEALRIFEEFNDESNIAGILFNSADIADLRGETDEVRHLLGRSLEIQKKFGDQSGISSSLHTLGNIAYKQGDLDEAARLYRESLEITKKLGKHSGIASCLHGLGMLAHKHGQLDEAQQLYDESLSIDKKLGNQSGIADSFQALGTLAYDQGKFEEATKLYADSLRIEKRTGNKVGIASLLRDLGMLKHDQGEWDEADKLYHESLTIDRGVGNRRGIENSLRALGQLAYDRGKHDKARELGGESITIAKDLGDRAGLASSLHNLGLVSVAEENYETGEELFLESLKIFKQLDDRKALAECFESLGVLRAEQGLLQEARSTLDQALELAKQVGIPYRIASVTRSIAFLAEKEGDKTRAIQLLNDAMPIFEKLRPLKAQDAQRDLDRLQGESSGMP